MDDTTLEATAKRLRDAEIAGDYIGALTIIQQSRSASIARSVFLLAGHDVSGRTTREFWREAQAGIAAACRQKCDGYGLR